MFIGLSLNKFCFYYSTFSYGRQTQNYDQVYEAPTLFGEAGTASLHEVHYDSLGNQVSSVALAMDGEGSKSTETMCFDHSPILQKILICVQW